VGRKEGVTEQQLRDLADFETSSSFTELEKLVFRYTVAMTQSPPAVSDELFTELRRHFNPRQMVEYTSVIAWQNYLARFDHAIGLEAEGFSSGAFCPLPTTMKVAPESVA